MTPDVHGVPGAEFPFRLVLLVGFMASGKTSVGRRLAARLGWEFVDADAEVEARSGLSVEAIFRERGEEGFREIEGRVTADLLEGRRRVVASGGGWPAADPDRLYALPDEILSVWLRVPASVAVDRARREGRVRPLLDVEDPEESARELLGHRRSSYARARLHLDASKPSPDALASAIVEYLAAARRTRG